MNKETVETHGNIGSIGAFNNDQEKEVWVVAFRRTCESMSKGGRREFPFDVADDAVLEFRSRVTGTNLVAAVARAQNMRSQALIAAQDVMKAAGIDISMHPANAVGVLIEQRDEARAKVAALNAELAKHRAESIGPITINASAGLDPSKVREVIEDFAQKLLSINKPA